VIDAVAARDERSAALVAWARRPLVRRAVRDGLTIAGLLFFLYRFLVFAPAAMTVGSDAVAYWAVDPTHPYSVPNGEMGAFLYSPPFVRLFGPAALLSWPAFLWLWMALLVATTIWLGWRRTIFVLAIPPVALELYFGNVNLLIAAAIALGFRYPATWAFVLLSKVTPGVGLLWFAVRREWRSLAIALGVTAVIVVVSYAIDAPLWSQWFQALQRDSESPLGGALASPIWFRLPVAAAIVMWGARSDRRWTVPVAATLAMPVLWVAALSVLTALFAIDRPELRERTAQAPSAASRS
jgi:hypothetical protein